MPDTSRAARYVLKDYVNAKLLYGHPPPNMTSDDYMSSSREKTLRELEEAFDNGRKRAPVTHVSKNADTFVRPAAAAPDGDQLVEGSSASAARQRQFTTNSIKANAASAPMRSGKQKAEALDGVFFNDVGPAPRPVLTGRQQRKEDIQEGLGYSRPTQYPHQRMLGPDGMPLIAKPGKNAGSSDSKRHFKGREGKKRSGRGYD
jgi:large subunit GTPase 1